MKKMKTQMMIKCKNNKIEISRLWLPEILLTVGGVKRTLNVWLDNPSCSRETSTLWLYIT
jgi:hypothetical protein